MNSKINENFLAFIDKTPNAFCCIQNLKDLLIENGFEELYENEAWDTLKSDGKYFVIRNDSSMIAFKMINPRKCGFNIVAAHTDSPSFSIKTSPEMYENGYLKLNVDGYGGMLNYSWLDRPLSLAGRVTVLDKGIYRKETINIDKDLLVIPSQAIHINRNVDDKNDLNHQIDMLPVLSLSETNIKDIIKSELNLTLETICDYDLYLYNRDKAKICGLNGEFILAPRLDDLASLYATVQSFIDSNNLKAINVLCAFNNEEIGSLTEQGADSSFLMDILTRISKASKIDLLSSLANSFLVSADNAHALHPNAQAKSDPTNKVYLNQGVVIKHHINYTTDGWTSSLFKGICMKAGVPFQDFASKSDMKCGSTLGGISQSHVSVESVDIGIPQLAMHAANEMIGTDDVLYMYKSLLEFYKVSFIKNKNTINLLGEEKN